MPRVGRGNGTGAGKPKGYKAPKTLEKLALADYLRQRILAEQDELVTAQLELAKGAYEFYGREVDGTWKKVTDSATILRCLQSGESFYRIEALKPNQQALTECWNRVIGKPSEQHHVDLAVSGNVTVTHVHED